MNFRSAYIILLAFMLYIPAVSLAQDTTYTVTTEFEAADDEPSEYGSEISPLNETDKSDLVERKIDPAEIERLKKDDDFWYVDEYHEEKKPVPTTGESWLAKLAKQPWFQPFIWTLIIGSFLAILIWFLLTSGLLNQRPKKIIQSMTVEAENIFEIDFDDAIAQAVNAGNFRLAVRLRYLSLLKELSTRNIIAYNPQLTNSDYVMQLSNSNYYKSFFSITRNFEWAWYGDFYVSPAAYEKIGIEVDEFKNRLA